MSNMYIETLNRFTWKFKSVVGRIIVLNGDYNEPSPPYKITSLGILDTKTGYFID
jgi:hypothetical protein